MDSHTTVISAKLYYGNGWVMKLYEDADAISARELLATRSQPPACGLTGPTRPGPHSPRPPPAPPTRDSSPLASDYCTINTVHFHFTLFTLVVLSSLMYSTCTFVDSDDIIFFTFTNNKFSLFTYGTHHSHDQPPKCGERTAAEKQRTSSARFVDPPPIAFEYGLHYIIYLKIILLFLRKVRKCFNLFVTDVLTRSFIFF